MNLKFWLAVAIASCLDLTDYILIGFIPFFGDALDIIGVFLLYPLIGKYALIGLAELVPLLDIAPSFLVAVFLSRTDIMKGVLGAKSEA